MATYAVMKTQKVNGYRQTWAVYTPRPNVSATVWERVDGVASYYTAAYARDVAGQIFNLTSDMWLRRAGRGSAYYTQTERA